MGKEAEARLLAPGWTNDYAVRIVGGDEQAYDARVIVDLLLKYGSFPLPRSHVRVSSLGQIRATYAGTPTAQFLVEMSERHPQLGAVAAPVPIPRRYSVPWK